MRLSLERLTIDLLRRSGLYERTYGTINNMLSSFYNHKTALCRKLLFYSAYSENDDDK